MFTSGLDSLGAPSPEIRVDGGDKVREDTGCQGLVGGSVWGGTQVESGQGVGVGSLGDSLLLTLVGVRTLCVPQGS